MAAETIDERGRRAGEALRNSVSHLAPPPLAERRSTRPARLALAAAAVLVVAVAAVAVASRDDDDKVITITDTPGRSALVGALPEASRQVVVVDIAELKAVLGVPVDHGFVPPMGPTDQTLIEAVSAVLPHLGRPGDGATSAAIDVGLIVRAAGNECAMGVECLAVVETRQGLDDLRSRLGAEGWSADGELFVHPGSAAEVSYPVIGFARDLVFLGQDQATVRDALAERSAPPDQLTAALDQVNGPVRRALPCGDVAASIGSTPGSAHQIASQRPALVDAGDTVTLVGDDYLVSNVTTSGAWSVVTIEPPEGAVRPLTHLTDPSQPAVVPAVLAATFSC